MLPGQPAVISNSTWFIYGQIARAVSVVAGVIASIVAGVKPSKKPAKPKPVATKAAVAKTSLPETAPVKAPGVKAAATETAAMGLGSSSGDHGSKGNHNYGCVFNNLRVMRPSFSLPSPDSLSHPRHV
jgi:hypothetical protein